MNSEDWQQNAATRTYNCHTFGGFALPVGGIFCIIFALLPLQLGQGHAISIVGGVFATVGVPFGIIVLIWGLLYVGNFSITVQGTQITYRNPFGKVTEFNVLDIQRVSIKKSNGTQVIVEFAGRKRLYFGSNVSRFSKLMSEFAHLAPEAAEFPLRNQYL